jgi:hypothetical protein
LTICTPGNHQNITVSGARINEMANKMLFYRSPHMTT